MCVQLRNPKPAPRGEERTGEREEEEEGWESRGLERGGRRRGGSGEAWREAKPGERGEEEEEGWERRREESQALSPSLKRVGGCGTVGLKQVLPVPHTTGGGVGWGAEIREGKKKSYPWKWGEDRVVRFCLRPSRFLWTQKLVSVMMSP